MSNRRDDDLERELRDVLTSGEYYTLVRALSDMVELLQILSDRSPAAARRLVAGRLKQLEQRADLPEEAKTGLEQFVEALLHQRPSLPSLGKKHQARVTLLRRPDNSRREKRR